MNSKSDLFDLIKSLDKHEKRFLKLYVKLHNPNKLPQYLHLFEVFENMKRFDKTQMIAELSKVVSGVNIGQLKQYLKRNIFKTFKSIRQKR